MTDLFRKTPSSNQSLPTVRDHFFSTSIQETLPPLDLFDFENAPRKVDVLLRANMTTGTVDTDLFERIAIHPRLGTFIVFGASEAERVVLMARAILMRINLRFCESESELLMLLNKRRSRPIVNSQ
jgi:hypothetical protein